MDSEGRVRMRPATIISGPCITRTYNVHVLFERPFAPVRALVFTDHGVEGGLLPTKKSFLLVYTCRLLIDTLNVGHYDHALKGQVVRVP
jgi:hypothetical protein